MKEYRIKDLDKFLEIAGGIESTHKFFQVDGESVIAEIFMRSHLISFRGSGKAIITNKLVDHDFVEVEILETKKESLFSE